MFDVPRPTSGLSSAANSWLEQMKQTGQNTMSSISSSSGVQAVTERATALSQGVSDAIKNSPASGVSQAIGDKGEQMKTLITGQHKEPETAADYVEEAMTMSYRNRLIAFVICLASGVFFTALSTLMLPMIVIKPHKFAVSYSLGNLLMLGSTAFLVGPKKQIQNMCQGHRALASSSYVAAMVGTIYSALWLRVWIMVLACIGVQFAALVWYSLSYIPFGRQLAARFLKPAVKLLSACLARVCGCCLSQCAPNLLPR
uniref:Vesicle transport protein n=1 Tax=Hemiselmis tepida TaxID=464990 RepID=A0A7S0YNV7_9CRYP